MKICFLTHTLNIDSGWGRYSREVISRIKKKKDVKIIVLTEQCSNDRLSVPILRGSLKNLFFVFYNALKIRKYIRQCDIIHCLDAYPYGVIGTLANIGLNKKLIVNGVGSYSVAPLKPNKKGGILRIIYRKIRSKLLQWTYQKANCVPCISHYFEKELLKIISLKNTKVVYLGVDSNKFQKGIVENSFRKIILSVGGLKRRKGYHISISAMARVKEKYPDFRYYIVGCQDNQKFFNYLKSIVNQYQLTNNVVFLEKINDQQLVNFYHQSNLFLLPSVNVGLHFEGLGLVYLEANACGKPVIGTYNCGAEDVIKDGYNGFLVPQEDIGKTSEAILKILDNPILAKKMGENGKKRVQEMNWQKTIEEYVKIYKE